MSEIRIKKIINSYEPLHDWFLKNEYEISLLKLPNINIIGNSDLIVLREMVDAAYRWFNISDNVGLSPRIKAYNASQAIKNIYKIKKDNLSIQAQENYLIKHGEINKSHEIILKK